MANVPLHNPRVRYTIVRPDGTRVGRLSRFIGYFVDRQAFVDQALHGEPLGTVMENLRHVDKKGRDLPTQAAIFLGPEPRTEKHGTVRATATATPGSVMARATRPKVLRASDAAHNLAKENGDEIYPGVVPWTPPPGSEEVDYDKVLPPEPLGLATPDPEAATDAPPNADDLERQRAAARARGAAEASDRTRAAADETVPAVNPPATVAPNPTPQVGVRGEGSDPRDKPPTQSKG